MDTTDFGKDSLAGGVPPVKKDSPDEMDFERWASKEISGGRSGLDFGERNESPLGGIGSAEVEDFLRGMSPPPIKKELDPLKQEVSNTISATKDFLDDLTAEYARTESVAKNSVESGDTLSKEVDKQGFEKDYDFTFSKPLPDEPLDDDLAKFQKSEEMDDLSPPETPPPIPKHRSDSPPFEPSHTPEPDFSMFKEEMPPTPPPHKPSLPLETKVKKDDPQSVPVISKEEEKYNIGADDLFTQYGLDAWFNPERLHPKVEALVYWRNPKKSGAVFGVLMLTLLSLIYCSLISVVAHLCALVLCCCIAFRIYKNVMQAVQKTSDGHPFKEFLEMDLNLNKEKVQEATLIAVERINRVLNELRRLFLVEDLIDSIKFGVMLWALTYVGAWFNGLTLVIIGVVAVFTLPKVYENNKAQIDQYLSLAMGKISEITTKVKAAVPMGKKDGGEKPKDQ